MTNEARPDPIKDRITAALRDVTGAFDDVASLDQLTGLWNLRRLTERIEEFIEDDHPIGQPPQSNKMMSHGQNG